MNVIATAVFAAAAWWGLACAFRLGAFVAAVLQPLIQGRRATRPDRPPVSVIIPVRQDEPDADAAFSSAFGQSNLQFEVLVTAAEEISPVLDAARRVAARHPDVPARFLTGNPQFTLNPKVSSLAPAIEAAEHDLLLVKDSNVRLAPGQIDDLIGNLAPGVGLVCAFPIAVEPATFAAEIERVTLNGHSAPLLLAASAVGIGVGFGKVMLFDRRAFRRAGGISVMADTFGDDHALARGLGRIGLRTVFAASTVRQVLGRRRLREVWDRQLRWLVIRRREEPIAFVAEPFLGGLFTAAAGALGAAALGVPAWMVAGGTLAGWVALEGLFALIKGWGWSWRSPFAALCREAMILALWAAGWFARSVTWGGQSHAVNGRPSHGSQGPA